MSVKEKSKSKKNKSDGKQQSDAKKEAYEGWVVFCDFHEIIHTAIKEATVSIYRQDKKMVRQEVDYYGLCQQLRYYLIL